MQRDMEDRAVQVLAEWFSHGDTQAPIVQAQVTETREHMAEAKSQATNPWTLGGDHAGFITFLALSIMVRLGKT